MEKIKIISITFIVILVANIILFAMGKISVRLFWLIIFIIGLIAYKGMDKIQKWV